MGEGPERITSLAEPPVVGRWYLVPTIDYPWLSDKIETWPVFLPRHDDREHLKFDWPHYHVDPRFLASRTWSKAITAGAAWANGRRDEHAYAHCQRVPLMRLGPEREVIPHSPIVWRGLRCARASTPYLYGHHPNVADLKGHFAGRTCKRARSGWVCPHKHFPLGSVVPVDGVITCPLHGLRVRSDDGQVLPHG